jgi:hypothetical protein
MNFILTNQLNPVVSDWVRRVKKNGGTQPTTQTVQAVNTFYNGIVANDLSSSMIAVNVMAPESLITCQTPLIQGAWAGGLDPWINTNFVSTDLTYRGLQGNGSNKYLETGITASSAWPAPSATGSAGFSLYVTSGSNGFENDIGCWASGTGTSLVSGYVGYGGTCYWDCWNAGTGRVSSANSLWTGFITFNRTAINASRVDRAKSSLSYSTLVSGATTTGNGPPTLTVQVFKMSNNAGSYSRKTFSFVAIHKGLSFYQGQTFYNLVQTLRQQMGGGSL